MQPDHQVDTERRDVGEARPRRALLALLLLVPAPSIGAGLGMALPATAGTALGQFAYAGGKVWLIVFPAVWWLFIDRGRPGFSPVRRGGLGVGAGLGVLISVVIIGAYLLLGRGLIDPAAVRQAAEGAGIATPARYLALAVYICTINAMLEEYVWRWFVFRKCETVVGDGRLGRWAGAAAVGLSALLFTVHHVIALGAQFGVVVTVLGSAGVFVGGCVWSWCYLRYRSIWPGFVSHVIVDIAVFWIGWRLIFG